MDTTSQWVEREGGKVSGVSSGGVGVWSLTPILSCRCVASGDEGVAIGGPSSDSMSEVVTPFHNES